MPRALERKSHSVPPIHVKRKNCMIACPRDMGVLRHVLWVISWVISEWSQSALSVSVLLCVSLSGFTLYCHCLVSLSSIHTRDISTDTVLSHFLVSLCWYCLQPILSLLFACSVRIHCLIINQSLGRYQEIHQMGPIGQLVKNNPFLEMVREWQILDVTLG